MATDGPTPEPCNPEIFKNGTGVCVLDGSSNAIETWVQAVAKKADAQVDWHYSGGRGNVLHLGDEESRQRVFNAIEELKDELKGTILSVGGPALYRNIPDEETQTEPEPEGEYPRAKVVEIDGQLVLDDPDALAMIQAVGKHNCKGTLDMNADRVVHFKNRITEKGLTSADAVIVLLNVDDTNGEMLADVLMPDFDWQQIRDRGEVPFARGLADRKGIEESLGFIDKDAATKLRDMTDVAVVVVDHGVAEVFPA